MPAIFTSKGIKRFCTPSFDAYTTGLSLGLFQPNACRSLEHIFCFQRLATATVTQASLSYLHAIASHNFCSLSRSSHRGSPTTHCKAPAAP